MSPPRTARLASMTGDPSFEASDPFLMARKLQAPVWVFDIDQARIVFANAPACQLWQADNETALRDRDMSSDMSTSVAKRMSQYQIDFAERDARFNEMWTLYPNGEPVSVMVIFSGYPLIDGRMGMLCEVVGGTDDTPENLRSAEALLHTDVMISLYQRAGPSLYMNPAARNIAFDATQTLADIFADPLEFRAMTIQLDNGVDHRAVAQIKTAQGARWHDLSVKSCLDAATGKPAILVTATDVTELKNARDTARYLADRDPLTGCFNRSYLQNHITMLSEERPDSRWSLYYFDIDRFKQINDQFGHEMGDIVLKAIASRAMSAMSSGDIIARLGGDEFIMLVAEGSAAPVFGKDHSQLLKLFARSIFHGNMRINVSVSVGITSFSPGALEFESVLKEADIALYAAKQAGRNRATVFEPEMGLAARERDQIAIALQEAVAQQDFVLYYQPRMDLRSGRIVSVEGLVRWNHPSRGIIAPSMFIPMCEETGLIADLGQQVLEIGCRQAMSWNADGTDLAVSINISPRQFNDDRLMKSLQDFAKLPDFPCDRIELEITEGVLIGDHDLIAQKLEAITNMGYHVAIDDFGTGYSNLSYISRFPLNCLKIDQSFINQLPASGPIITLILTLGRQIGATIVAEGVETKEQFDWLRAQGCDQVQGYYLARPVPLEELEPSIAQSDAITRQ